MQVTKIYCDCCGEEFTKTDKDTFGDVDVNIMTGKWIEGATTLDQTKREILRFKSNDVCKECSEKIYKFINSLKLKP